MRLTLALFGASEKGKFKTAYFCQTLDQLESYLGHPPPETQGLYLAIQALLFERNLIFFRVEEEGFSKKDYFHGLEALKNDKIFKDIHAVALPGVGDQAIIDETIKLCHVQHSLLILNEKDLYDYLTNYPEKETDI